MTKSRFTRFAIVAAALAGAALSARADIIPTFTSDPAVGSNFKWNYSTSVTLDQRVDPGDFFTIYDFKGLVPGTNTQPTGWTFSSSLLGTTPGRVAVNDDPNVPNLTWTYNGPSQTGPMDLGTFSALSKFNLLSKDDFAAQATRSTGPNTGSKIDNVGTVSVPVPEMSALLPIVAVCSVGAMSVLFRRRRAS